MLVLARDGPGDGVRCKLLGIRFSDIGQVHHHTWVLVEMLDKYSKWERHRLHVASCKTAPPKKKHTPLQADEPHVHGFGALCS